MELVTDWDLHNLRFGDGSSRRARRCVRAAICKINANLSDGFDGATASAALLGGAFVGVQPHGWRQYRRARTRSLCCRPGQLAAGKGSVIVGGTADTHRVFLRSGARQRAQLVSARSRTAASCATRTTIPSRQLSHRLGRAGARCRHRAIHRPGHRRADRQGSRDRRLRRHGDVRASSAALDLLRRGRRLRSATAGRHGGRIPAGCRRTSSQFYQQWDNSTGYLVRTGTGSINIAAGKNVVLQERPSVIYTAGESAAPVAGFYAPTGVAYSGQRRRPFHSRGGRRARQHQDAADAVGLARSPQRPRLCHGLLRARRPIARSIRPRGM